TDDAPGGMCDRLRRGRQEQCQYRRYPEKVQRDQHRMRKLIVRKDKQVTILPRPERQGFFLAPSEEDKLFLIFMFKRLSAFVAQNAFIYVGCPGVFLQKSRRFRRKQGRGVRGFCVKRQRASFFYFIEKRKRFPAKSQDAGAGD